MTKWGESDTDESIKLKHLQIPTPGLPGPMNWAKLNNGNLNIELMFSDVHEAKEPCGAATQS